MPVPNPAHPFQPLSKHIKDVILSALADGDVLTYEAATALWKNKVPHRKWSWADEQSYGKMFHIPLAFGTGNWTRLNNGNPVLQKSTSGWDGSYVTLPSVIKYGNYYYMAYGSGTYQLGLARSTDKITWTKSGDNPIIPYQVSSWKRYVCYSSLMIDYPAGVFRWFYDASNDADTVHQLGFATCPLTSDPMVKANWTEYAGNPVYNLTTNSMIGAYGAMRLGLAYYLGTLKTDASAMKVICSGDSINWTYIADVMGLGAAGEWDDFYMAYPTWFWNLGNFYLFYTGNRSGISGKIGVAVAGEDGTSFVKLFKNKANPVLGNGAGGKWDATGTVFAPSLMMEGQSFYMWYSGGSPYAIGLAKLNLDY